MRSLLWDWNNGRWVRDSNARAGVGGGPNEVYGSIQNPDEGRKGLILSFPKHRRSSSVCLRPIWKAVGSRTFTDGRLFESD